MKYVRGMEERERDHNKEILSQYAYNQIWEILHHSFDVQENLLPNYYLCILTQKVLATKLISLWYFSREHSFSKFSMIK